MRNLDAPLRPRKAAAGPNGVHGVLVGRLGGASVFLFFSPLRPLLSSSPAPPPVGRLRVCILPCPHHPFAHPPTYPLLLPHGVRRSPLPVPRLLLCTLPLSGLRFFAHRTGVSQLAVQRGSASDAPSGFVRFPHPHSHLRFSSSCLLISIFTLRRQIQILPQIQARRVYALPSSRTTWTVVDTHNYRCVSTVMSRAPCGIVPVCALRTNIPPVLEQPANQ
ncbi:hypothetical protein OH77DRAFT_773672 [Trametes cingulata]|nr:hypothetical protein OH77DRAFT_773672 [Trametes cingulata]